ncbi:nodulation S family protein [Mesorhizobium sp. M0166]|uniref:SAM-dependent methyltransferase n=1 Tax=Mesorhizobium sp. M0166 TaxID=2956902 RepID=UPI00333D7904
MRAKNGKGSSLTHDDQLLRLELPESNPWQVEASAFKRKCNRQLLRLALCAGPITHGLQVGCGTGAFTKELAPHCERLTVMDVEPQTLSLTRLRMQGFSHIDWAVYEEQRWSGNELFNLIVLTDLLCHFPSIAELPTATENLVGMLAPDGHLIFGSARDSIRRHWGNFAGAESAIATLNPKLSQLLRVRCQGDDSSEDYVFVLFKNAAQAADGLANERRD